MSLKAPLQGQQGCDLFWSTATNGASGTYEPDGRLQSGKPRGTGRSPPVQRVKETAKEDKEKEMLLYKYIKALQGHCLVTLSLTLSPYSPKYEA